MSNTPLLWLAPQSDHGNAACAETEAFFQSGPPQSFFELSWLALQKAISEPPPLMARFAVQSRECRAHGALQKARAREVGARMMTGRKFLRLGARSAIRSRECRVRGNCSFFPIWPAAVLFQANLARLTKSTRAGSCAATDDNKFLSPPLLWLAPQSDHGSAACAETKAFLQYGPPQSFAEPGSPYKKNVHGKLAQGLMTRRKVLSPPALGACSAIRSRERRTRGN